MFAIGLAAEAATAFADADNLTNPTRRMKDLTYGLNEICLPAQRQGVSVDSYISANESTLRVKRARNLSSTQTEIWLVGSKKYVSVMQRGANCTVSTSFSKDRRFKIMDELEVMLNTDASYVEVIHTMDEEPKDRARSIYCRPNPEGENDSYIFDQWIQELDPPHGSRRRRKILFLSISAPTQTICTSN